MFFKRLKCMLFCNKPYRLLPYKEKIEEGILRMAECPKCGLVCSILNRYDEILK